MNVRSGWTGNSLEGSAVTEIDPLDMSEEAKAERWFKRVAQIKDISELSQIPDEDYPSIMTMRKGVNWFVVSKKKTPLERRLTSPQYRKNLRIMSSNPMKREVNTRNFIQCSSLTGSKSANVNLQGYLEGANFLATGKLESLSEQQLVDCDNECDPESQGSCDAGCNGGLFILNLVLSSV
ncbi:zinc finger (Ran-binding) family protein [Artemisia annua]|uniref:Zinc finger (Ran-binding) family protein n=1 Tax=Artemisia annua TaxID=35608 RepID=A0A2U1QIF7_ARTAN|nr:zinc finger (Ran-binding) family protein [Artemisia annua]